LSNKTRYLVYGAMFTAISVILSSFLKIQLTDSIRISLAPAIIMVAGSVLGPAWGAGIGFVTDFLSYIIANRASGAYFPGYALTMALYGLLAGLLFYKRHSGYIKIILSTIGIQTLCSLVINTLWTSVMYGSPYIVMLATRLPTTYISCALYVAVMCFVVKNNTRIFRKIHQPV